jgi:hypothetical protein
VDQRGSQAFPLNEKRGTIAALEGPTKLVATPKAKGKLSVDPLYSHSPGPQHPHGPGETERVQPRRPVLLLQLPHNQHNLPLHLHVLGVFNIDGLHRGVGGLQTHAVSLPVDVL